MSTPLGDAVELLDRALAYTRVSLASIVAAERARAPYRAWPTPCRDWDLGRLLAHLEDSLDAFTEAASGHVDVEVPRRAAHPGPGQVAVLRDKACTLLGAWAGAVPGDPGDPAGPVCVDPVAVGDLDLAGPTLVATAALEIAVHGWDVAQATGSRTRIPGDLARDLLDVAHVAVDPADRDVRFARAMTPLGSTGRLAQTPYDVQLLLFLGRDPEGPRGARAEAGDPRPEVAS